MDTWSAGPGTAQVQHNGTTNTLTTDGTAGVFPPGTVIMNPGYEGNSIADDFSVIRFTAPSNGNYRVDAAVHTYLDGPISGDTDFHVVKGNDELFGQFIPGNGGAHYSNIVNLAAGESLDFLCGLGADARQYASGLKIASEITFLNSTTNLPPPPDTNSIPTRPGLIGWWPGEGNANDVACGHNGVALNGVTYVPAKVGQGFNLNGQGAYISISNSPDLNLANELTVECWFLSRKWSPGGFGLYSKRDAAGKANYGANISSALGVDVYYNDPSVNDGDFGSDYEISAYFPVPSLNAFHHFASIFQQVDANHIQLETYLDGVLVTNKTKLGSLANTLNGAPLIIGATGASEYFDGIIDEFALYNRALNAGEIRSIYRADARGKHRRDKVSIANGLASVVRHPSGVCQVTFTMESEANYLVEVSENLTDWSPLSEPSSGTEISVEDPEANGAAHRFYRIRPLP